jgi:hypothetical protein
MLDWKRRLNGKEMNVYEILVGKSTEKCSLWGRLEDYTERELREADGTS